MSSTPSYDQANLALETLNDKITALTAKYDPQEARKAVPVEEIKSIRNNAEKIAEFLKTASEEEQVKFIAQAMNKYEAIELLNKLNLMIALEKQVHQKDNPRNNELLKEVEAIKVFNNLFESMKDIIETLPARFEKAQDLYATSNIIAQIEREDLSQEWLVHKIKEASAKSDSVATEKYTQIYQQKFGDFKPEEHKQQFTTEQQQVFQSMDKRITPVPTQEDIQNKQKAILQILLLPLVNKVPPETLEPLVNIKLDSHDPDFEAKTRFKDILSTIVANPIINQKNAQLPPAPPTPEEEKNATTKKSSGPKPKPESKPKEPDDLPSSEVFAKKSAVTAQIEEIGQKKKNDDGNIKPSEIAQENAKVKPQPDPNTPPPPPTAEVVEKKNSFSSPS